MFTDTDFVIRFSGDEHPDLRAQAHCILASTNLHRVKIGKVMLSHYRGPNLSDEQCIELLHRLYALAASFGSKARISYISISSYPNVSVVLSP
jgi:hypothetical protein